MFGGFRLVLAILVALSHVNIRIYDLNPGVIAVVCFYIISGYVMTGLIKRYYSGIGEVKYFYLDRAIRLLPQYFIVLILTFLWFVFTRPANSFLQQVPSVQDILNNLVIVPLNYFMFNQSDKFTLIPPAWSLGAEIQFYILLPWLLMFRLRTFSFVLAGIVYLVAAWGIINTDTFGYRILPGVLLFFLLGSFLFELRKDHKALLIFVLGVFVAVSTIGLVLREFNQFHLSYNKETLLGILIGVIGVVLLERLPNNKFDNLLGDLSYGVFLNHFLIQWTVFGVPETTLSLILYVGCSVILSGITQILFEKPLLHLRHKFRREA